MRFESDDYGVSFCPQMGRKEWDTQVYPIHASTQYQSSHSTHSQRSQLTIVKYGGNILGGKLVGGVGYQQTGSGWCELGPRDYFHHHLAVCAPRYTPLSFTFITSVSRSTTTCPSERIMCVVCPVLPSPSHPTKPRRVPPPLRRPLNSLAHGTITNDDAFDSLHIAVYAVCTVCACIATTRSEWRGLKDEGCSYEQMSWLFCPVAKGRPGLAC